MSSFCKCKSYSHFFSKNISIYAIFNNQSFNDLCTNNIVSFEKPSPAHIYKKIILGRQLLVCKGYLPLQNLFFWCIYSPWFLPLCGLIQQITNLYYFSFFFFFFFFFSWNVNVKESLFSVQIRKNISQCSAEFLPRVLSMLKKHFCPPHLLQWVSSSLMT